jgi:chemotaxis protein methyltransferase CheR
MGVQSKISVPAGVGEIDPATHEVVSRIAKLIAEKSGNVLEEKQFPMIANRLNKRMISLNLKTLSDYESYLNKNKSTEVEELVGLLTTHHTFFFREFVHFEFILKNLKFLVEGVKKRGDNTLKIWSSACSRGQEVYSLAMFLKHHLKEIEPGLNFKILGTDIDVKSVEVGMNGVYHEREVKEIPSLYLADNVVRGKEDISDYYKFKKNITSHCEFKTFNLLTGKYKDLGKFDLIFCRNVLIYFKDQDTQKVVNSFEQVLYDSGYLITGLSESLIGRVPKVNSLGASCYTFTRDDVHKAPIKMNTAKLTEEKLVKVLCVDDSPSVLKILANIFTKDAGFEIVGTAMNGVEAETFLKNHQVDLVTLDIHMPEMDGVSYLRKNFRFGKHPPVLMISSVSRNDDALAQKALAFGASDFIEKPSLQDMEKKTLEIRTKAKVCIHRSSEKPHLTSFDLSLKKNHKFKNVDNKLIVLHCSLIDRYKVGELLKDTQKEDMPPMVIIHSEQNDAHKFLLMESIKLLSTTWKVHDSIPLNGKLEKNSIYISEPDLLDSEFANVKKGRDTLFMVFGAVPTLLSSHLSNLSKDVYLVIEEIKENNSYMSLAREFVPITTMTYIIGQYFSRDNNEKVA